MLYLIEFLHQTTTGKTSEHEFGCCILLNFYIKPQQYGIIIIVSIGCILLNFYIKPQQ